MVSIFWLAGIVGVIFGILNIILFFKLWGMTNDVAEILGIMRSEALTRRARADMPSQFNADSNGPPQADLPEYVPISRSDKNDDGTFVWVVIACGSLVFIFLYLAIMA